VVRVTSSRRNPKVLPWIGWEKLELIGEKKGGEKRPGPTLEGEEKRTIFWKKINIFIEGVVGRTAKGGEEKRRNRYYVEFRPWLIGAWSGAQKPWAGNSLSVLEPSSFRKNLRTRKRVALCE